MSSVFIVRGRYDVQLAEQIRVDLTLRHWSVDTGSFTLGRDNLGDYLTSRAVLVIVPEDAAEQEACISWIRGAIAGGAHPHVVSPETLILAADVLSGARGVSFRGSLTYDRLFDEFARSLMPDLPPWLDVSVRPSLIQSPTGVAWWADDLFVADDRYDHVVRVSPADSTVLIPGLFEPHHVSVNRRRLVVANKSADEVLYCDVVDQMAARVRTIHSVNNIALARPHGAVLNSRVSVIADTDNNRVLVRQGEVGDWTEARPRLPFSQPCGVCIDASGVWVADTFNHRVIYFDDRGAQRLEFGGYGESGVQFAYPVGIQRWRNLLFVADEESEKLKVFIIHDDGIGGLSLRSLDGSFADQWISQPFGISINRNNRMAIADRKEKCIWIVDLALFMRDYSGDLP